MMIFLSGYGIEKLIYSGSKNAYYRGAREKDGVPAVIKVPIAAPSREKGRIQVTHEHNLLNSLNIKGIPKSRGVKEYRDGFALILEDSGGSCLAGWKPKGFNVGDVMTIASKLAELLGELHANGVTHKDINPESIFYEPETGAVWLADFRCAIFSSPDNHKIPDPGMPDGTPPYMSPEQTGRMNRSVDFRTDFYSLGVTLYEMLTGTLPFKGSNSLEIVHSHLALQPRPPHESNLLIPETVSSLLMKLLSKSPEDRYQSAWGMKADFDECLRQLEKKGKIDYFPLGSHDISGQLTISRKLYGREQERELLLKYFDRIGEGPAQMIMVGGYSGIGKTSLVQEICRPLTAGRGNFICGKFDQLHSGIPYSGLMQAFQDLVGQLLGENKERMQQWKDQLLSVLGTSGQVIIDVIPDMELVIGPQPPLMELGADEGQNRFNHLFIKFMSVFCRKEHPLVIFLDDLQWVDRATLKLIELIMNTGELRHILLIGAYRKNEVDEWHPLMAAIDAIVKHGDCIRYIDVPPLSTEHVAEMIADTLRQDRKDIKDLAELVAFKSGGNPFFATHFLTMLHQEKLLTFDTALKSWKWDFTKIKALEITDNVIDLLIHQLHRMPDETQFMLRMASCIGSRFDIKMLELITGFSGEVICRDLIPAVQQDLIIPIRGVHIRETADHEPGEAEIYRFQHDRIQQAAYARIPEAKRKPIHLQIGRALLEHFDAGKRGEDIFDILVRLNFAAELMTSSEERLNLARLNLMAARKAKSSAAFENALDYAGTGMSLLPEDGWTTCYELTLHLYLEYLETLRLNGRTEEMVPTFETVKRNARTPLETVGAYKSRIKGFMAQDQLREALVTAQEILSRLGEDDMPERADRTAIRRVLKKTMANIPVKDIKALIDLPEMTDPLHLATINILMTMISLTYFVVPSLSPHIVCRLVDDSIRYGNAPGSAVLYAAFGSFLCRFGEDIESGYKFGEVALALAEKPNAKEHKGQTLHIVCGCINHWKQPLRETLDLAIIGYRSALEVGDFEYASYNSYCYCLHTFLSGDPLEAVEREMEYYCNIVKRLKQQTSLRFHRTFRQTVLNLMGRSHDPCRFPDETTDGFYAQSNNRLETFYLSFCKLLLNYLFGNYKEAIHYADLAERENFKEVGGTLPISLAIFYDSLARLAIYADATDEEQRQILEKVAGNQKRMEMWAKHAPANYLQKFHLVEAERLAVQRDDNGAMGHYHQAIEFAQAHQFINDEALANELAAGFWFRKGMPAFADPLIKRAHACYTLWGSYAKVAHIEKRYPKLADGRPLKVETPDNHLPEPLPGSFSSGLDIATLMKVSHAISTEIDLERLLTALMRSVVENTGAERGSLILCSEGDLSIAAQYEAKTGEVKILPSIPIEQGQDISPAVVHYVARTRDFLIMNTGRKEGVFANDPYIMSQKPNAIFCGPMIHKERLISILYLESRLVPGVFPADRLGVIKILMSQMAVSIDNARLYEQLKKAEEKYRSIFENAVEGIYQSTVGGQFISANPAMAKILGYESVEDLVCNMADIGKTLYVSDEARTQLLDTIKEKKTVSGFEVQLYRKDGSTFWASLHVRLIYDQEGNPSSIEGIFTDITDKKKATEALRESEDYLRKENIRLRTNIKDHYRFGNIIGKSAVMKEVYELILKAAATNANVIISGESGTGKELVARAIHDMSDRKGKLLIPVNCGAIPENLMESEFFGYKRGAFTGASRDKQGYMDLADGGTLFLDELGELGLHMQVKLLRVLEGHGYIPVGGSEIRYPDVRFIAATNKDLQTQVKQGLMREDFFYRINIVSIHLPPLRERTDDIPLLVEHFTNEYGPVETLPPLTGNMWEAIMRYDWPGNIRELQNALHRYFAMNKFDLGISVERKPSADFSTSETIFNPETDNHRTAVDLYEKNLIEASLKENRWNREKTASSLGMSRRTFSRKMSKHGLTRHL
ncbi:MAG: sigma 54-interacting transcriptional regulator [Syntrophales bacterium]|nr:sigma 54-interacting transcriptional regulator [Syntrophales bacterium]